MSDSLKPFLFEYMFHLFPYLFSPFLFGSITHTALVTRHFLIYREMYMETIALRFFHGYFVYTTALHLLYDSV